MEFNLPVRILEAVGLLHREGFGSLRAYPGMNASGSAWRVALYEDQPSVSGAGATSGSDAAAGDKEECIRYSSAAQNEFVGAKVDAHTDARHLAELIRLGLPSLQVTTSHSEYVRWFAGLLDQVRTVDDLPVAYADYFDVSNGWELGWCSRRYYPEPPKQSTLG